MSMALHEKIRKIRKSVGLSRPEFADLTGIPSRTIEAIENKGNIPRGDVLEKIAFQWPRYAYWLLTDKTHSPTHIRPNIKERVVLRFYERLSNPIPEVSELMTKPEWFTRLVFLQCSDEQSNLYAFIETKQSERSGIKQCVLVDGGINFCSDGGGKNGLIDFAKFMIQQERADLIRTSEMKLVTKAEISNLYECWEIEERNLVTPDLTEIKWLRKIHINFTAWRMNNASYVPKYTYRDL